jgi:hypothetical protein
MNMFRSSSSAKFGAARSPIAFSAAYRPFRCPRSPGPCRSGLTDAGLARRSKRRQPPLVPSAQLFRKSLWILHLPSAEKKSCGFRREGDMNKKMRKVRKMRRI